MPIYEVKDDLFPLRKDGVGGFSALPVGTIFASAIPQRDARVHLLDGSTISQTGIYETFANLIKSLVAEGHNIAYTSDTEFYSDVSTYGQCGKFVIDDVAETIRLPLITEFIASNNGGQIIGLAELDEFKSHTHIQNAHNHSFTGTKATGSFNIRGAADGASYADKNSTASGVFSKNSSVVNTYIMNGTSSKYNAGLSGINFNMTPAGTVNSSTATNQNTGSSATKPKNIRYPYYIVLASDYSSPEVVDINNVVTELNGKQDKLTAELIGKGKHYRGQNDTVVESYVSSDGLSWYRIWASGWKECGGTIQASSSNGVGITYTLPLPNGFSDTLWFIWYAGTSDLSSVSGNVVYAEYGITPISATQFKMTTWLGHNRQWVACGW